MSITITEKDVGRKVFLESGALLTIEKFDRTSSIERLRVKLSNSAWYYSDGRSTGFFAQDPVVAFADESAAPALDETAAPALTENRVREVVREMMQPQPEKKELQRGECWINFYEDGSYGYANTLGDAKEYASLIKTKKNIARRRVEWTEGQFDD